jgi:hypothetical protein
MAANAARPVKLETLVLALQWALHVNVALPEGYSDGRRVNMRLSQLFSHPVSARIEVTPARRTSFASLRGIAQWPRNIATAFHKDCLNFGELVANSNGGKPYAKAITLIATSSVAPAQFRPQPSRSANGLLPRRDVRQLVPMMDKDQNGVVSKDEFMQFIGETFDRLDVNKTGTLAPRELQRTAIPRAAQPDLCTFSYRGAACPRRTHSTAAAKAESTR